MFRHLPKIVSEFPEILFALLQGKLATQLIRGLYTFLKVTPTFTQFVQDLQKIVSKCGWKFHEISIKMFQNYKRFLQNFSLAIFLKFYPTT